MIKKKKERKILQDKTSREEVSWPFGAHHFIFIVIRTGALKCVTHLIDLSWFCLFERFLLMCFLCLGGVVCMLMDSGLFMYLCGGFWFVYLCVWGSYGLCVCLGVLALLGL